MTDDMSTMTIEKTNCESLPGEGQGTINAELIEMLSMQLRIALERIDILCDRIDILSERIDTVSEQNIKSK